MDVQEVRKLDGYLKKLFGNGHIRVVPKGSDAAEVFVAEDDLGELTVDDEDGERSYNFRMVIQVGNDPTIQPVPNNVTVAGVPAKVVGEAGCPEPSRAMDQMLYGIMLDG